MKIIRGGKYMRIIFRTEQNDTFLKFVILENV